jgi:hypothetical protein
MQHNSFRFHYLQRLKKSREPRPVGELFAMKVRGVGYLYGRVIRNDCAVEALSVPQPWTRTIGLYLVYVYREVADQIEPVPQVYCERLLFPPVIIVGTGWTCGMFLPICQRQLEKTDVLPTHCFVADRGIIDGKRSVCYLDEYGNTLRQRSDPCRERSIGNVGTIEIEIAKSLGLPEADWWSRGF